MDIPLGHHFTTNGALVTLLAGMHHRERKRKEKSRKMQTSPTRQFYRERSVGGEKCSCFHRWDRLWHKRESTFNLHVNVCYFFLERNKNEQPVLLSERAQGRRSWGLAPCPWLAVTRSSPAGLPSVSHQLTSAPPGRRAPPALAGVKLSVPPFKTHVEGS